MKDSETLSNSIGEVISHNKRTDTTHWTTHWPGPLQYPILQRQQIKALATGRQNQADDRRQLEDGREDRTKW